MILPLKGYTYMEAAARSEGLLNRCRGKIPNLTKFTSQVDNFLHVAVAQSARHLADRHQNGAAPLYLAQIWAPRRQPAAFAVACAIFFDWLL